MCFKTVTTWQQHSLHASAIHNTHAAFKFIMYMHQYIAAHPQRDYTLLEALWRSRAAQPKKQPCAINLCRRAVPSDQPTDVHQEITRYVHTYEICKVKERVRARMSDARWLRDCGTFAHTHTPSKTHACEVCSKLALSLDRAQRFQSARAFVEYVVCLLYARMQPKPRRRCARVHMFARTLKLQIEQNCIYCIYI